MIFFLLAIAAMLGYSIYGTLIAHHVRKHDGLSVATVRNLSLAISMTPLLLLANPENFALLPLFITKIIIAGLIGATGLCISFWSLKFLPVGIKTAISRIGSVVFIFFFGWLKFGETPTLMNLLWIIPIIIGGIMLSLQKTKLNHLDSRTSIGVGLILLSSIFYSLTFIQMSDIARNLDPFIAGYFWEVSIGLWALLFGIIRWIICGKPIFGNIKLPDAGKIAIVSVPTLIGTGCFALAVTMGSIGIANVIGTGGIFISILLGHWLYHEKMTQQQWLWIGVCIAGLVGLGLAG
jgi:drug/metabolite transporter (DMT)-like permease